LYAHPVGFHELLFIMARCRRLMEFNAGGRGRDRGDRRNMGQLHLSSSGPWSRKRSDEVDLEDPARVGLSLMG
jgi:hypothetical protein